MSFDETIRELIRKIEKLELNILVWGSGKSDRKNYQKRAKIRRELRKVFKNADVRFSEDLDDSTTSPAKQHTSIPERELWHLAACDLCVVLDTSAGPAAEIAHFVASRYAHKLLVLTHKRYKNRSSFPASLREYTNQFFYSDEEFDSCSLVELVADRARQVGLAELAQLRV